MPDFIREVVLPISAIVLVIGSFIWAVAVCDKTESDRLLNEDFFVITAIYPSTNQFTINGSFLLRLEGEYRLDEKDSQGLEVTSILNSDLRNRVRISFNNNYGFLDCDVIGYLPDKHIKNPRKKK